MAKNNIKEPELDIMRRLYTEYGLTKDHIFDHKHYKIITRQGIDKIQASANIEIDYTVELLKVANESFMAQKEVRDEIYDDRFINIGDIVSVVIKAKGVRFDSEGKEVAVITTFGEASPSNCSNAYMMALAEKRAMARAVLKLAGLYEEGIFSEDEADDFRETVKKERSLRRGK